MAFEGIGQSDFGEADRSVTLGDLRGSLLSCVDEDLENKSVAGLCALDASHMWRWGQLPYRTARSRLEGFFSYPIPSSPRRDASASFGTYRHTKFRVELFISERGLA